MRIDFIMMAVYLVIVYASAVLVRPLGRDFAMFATGGESMPWLARVIFQCETAVFGGWSAPYVVVHLVLVYGVMISVYLLTNAVLRGPMWFGILAAVFVTTNPAHTEAILNLSGIVDLLPGFLGIVSTAMFADCARKPSWLKYGACLAVTAVATNAFDELAVLPIVFLLFEALITDSNKRRYVRIVPYFVVSALPLVRFGRTIAQEGFSIVELLRPLALFVYPIGFLPETVIEWRESLAEPIATVLLVGAFLAWVLWKAGSAAILFSLAAMLVVRFGTVLTPVDPYHLIGGGKLILANALCMIAVQAVFFRIWQHPKWKGQTVLYTTLFAAVSMGMQIRANLNWVKASRIAAEFQERIASAEGRMAGIVPDFRYYNGAPLMLSESVKYDTPFSRRVPALPLLELDHNGSRKAGFAVSRRSETELEVEITAVPLEQAVPYPYLLQTPGDELAWDGLNVSLTNRSPASATISVTSTSGNLPETLMSIAGVTYRSMD